MIKESLNVTGYGGKENAEMSTNREEELEIYNKHTKNTPLELGNLALMEFIIQ